MVDSPATHCEKTTQKPTNTVCIYTHVHIFIHTYTYTYIYMYVYIGSLLTWYIPQLRIASDDMATHQHCAYVHMYIYLYIYIHIHIYIHVYLHTISSDIIHSPAMNCQRRHGNPATPLYIHIIIYIYRGVAIIRHYYYMHSEVLLGLRVVYVTLYLPASHCQRRRHTRRKPSNTCTQICVCL